MSKRRDCAGLADWAPQHRPSLAVDPSAPPANSLVPSVNVIVANEADEIPADNGNSAVPGGAIDLGESVAQAAVRSMRIRITDYLRGDSRPVVN